MFNRTQDAAQTMKLKTIPFLPFNTQGTPQCHAKQNEIPQDIAYASSSKISFCYAGRPGETNCNSIKNEWYLHIVGTSKTGFLWARNVRYKKAPPLKMYGSW